MRKLVFAIAAVCILFWWIGVYRGDLLPRPLDPAGLPGVMLFAIRRRRRSPYGDAGSASPSCS